MLPFALLCKLIASYSAVHDHMHVTQECDTGRRSPLHDTGVHNRMHVTHECGGGGSSVLHLLWFYRYLLGKEATSTYYA